MNKLKLPSVAVALSLATTAPVLANAASLTDERFMTAAEFNLRNDKYNLNKNDSPSHPNSTSKYNIYRTDVSKPTVSAYVSNWGQYARDVNLMDQAAAYDKIIASFFGLCGSNVADPLVTSAVDSLIEICGVVGGKKYELMSTDIWGDFQSPLHGVIQPQWADYQTTAASFWYNGVGHTGQEPGGFMGQLKQIKKQHPEKTIAMSIFGWSLSEPASQMAAHPENRKVFVDSLVNALKTFPFFTQVDIDWEYPGAPSADYTPWTENDAENYATLIREIKAAFTQNNLSHVQLAIAAPAPVNKLSAAGVKDLVDAGLDIIHLMTYDFFGIPWAEKLTHSANLKGYDGSDWSAEQAIDYLIDVEGVPAKKIHLGYTTYSRSAAGAQITSFSPLEGTYSSPTDTNRPPLGDQTGGSFESGVYEWYDLEKEFLNITESDGVSFNSDKKTKGYKIYTDFQANADYIYSEERNFYISIDTPRSTYTKAKYVQDRELGGIFTWMADYDTGYLVNAAREGLGYQIQQQRVYMDNIINTCGVNIEGAQACSDLTNLVSTIVELSSNAGDDFKVNEINKPYVLNGSGSTGSISEYNWKITEALGVDINSIVLSSNDKKSPTITFNKEPKSEGAFVILRLQVSDAEGELSNDTVRVSFDIEESQNSAPTAKLSGPSVVDSGVTVTLDASKSNDVDNDRLTYRWAAPSGVNLSNNGSMATFTSGEFDADTPLTFTVEVSDGDYTDIARHTVTVKGKVVGGGDIPQYVHGTPYSAGDTVFNAGGEFECKPWPYTGWCSGAKWAYAPGTGLYWQQAWIKK
ncbi:glycosyl hydrolase family 18 protein [Vibrio splendidus]